jgi:hypothetical protein
MKKAESVVVREGKDEHASVRLRALRSQRKNGRWKAACTEI